jgi:glutathione S-transferase
VPLRDRALEGLPPELEEKFPQVLAKASATLEKHYANFDRELDGKEYLVGAFTRADIAVAPHLAAARSSAFPSPSATPASTTGSRA